jgi:hypothetical protein
VPGCVAQGDAALNAWEPLSLTHGVLRRGYDSRGGFGSAAVAQAEAVTADKAILKIMQATCAAQKYVQTKHTAGPRCRDSFKPLSSLRLCVCVLPMSPPPPPLPPPPPPPLTRYEAALDAVRQLVLPASLDIALVVANHATLATLAPKVQEICYLCIYIFA